KTACAYPMAVSWMIWRWHGFRIDNYGSEKRRGIAVAGMKRIATLLAFLIIVPAFLWSQTEADKFDFLIKDGTVYDGTGGDPIQADVGIKGDRIVAVGKLDRDQAVKVVDASGLAVAPGFINMLSWAVVSLIADGRSQS